MSARRARSVSSWQGAKTDVITWLADAARTFAGAVGLIITAKRTLAAAMSLIYTRCTDPSFASGCVSSMTITQHLGIRGCKYMPSSPCPYHPMKDSSEELSKPGSKLSELGSKRRLHTLAGRSRQPWLHRESRWLEHVSSDHQDDVQLDCR